MSPGPSRIFLLAALAAAALVWPAPPAARGEEDGFTGALGAAVAVRPEFEGSGRYAVRVLPVVNLRCGRAFLSADRGLGLEVVSDAEWTLAPALRYRPGRDQDDSELLRGLGDIDGGLEAGVLAVWRPGGGPVSLSLASYQGLGRAEGWTLEAAAKYSARLTESLRGSLGAAAMFADRDYLRQHFGVTPAQSGGSGYRAYEPGGGWKHASISAALSYGLTDALGLSLAGEYKRLVGPAADSPLLERGSADQFLSALSVTYSFR